MKLPKAVHCCRNSLSARHRSSACWVSSADPIMMPSAFRRMHLYPISKHILCSIFARPHPVKAPTASAASDVCLTVAMGGTKQLALRVLLLLSVAGRL